MPLPIATSQIQALINTILNDYTSTTDRDHPTPFHVLRSRIQDYNNGNRSQQNRKAQTDYKKILRLQKKLSQLQQFQCENCKRRQSKYLIDKYGSQSVYNFQIIQQSNRNIHMRKFKHPIITTKYHQTSINHHLCQQCNQHLCNEEGYSANIFNWLTFYRFTQRIWRRIL